MTEKPDDIFETIMDGIDKTKSVVHYANNDFEFSRENIRAVIEKANGALDELLKVAIESGHPRAYEVLTNLIGTIVTANKDLIDTKRINQEIASKDENDGGDTINNNLYITTAELVKLIENKKDPIE